MKVKIGIDVGGTFTDAVAINEDTLELVGTVKIPTTHSAKEGVAAGIVRVLYKLMESCQIRPEDVSFIAHGTTQATNALLEGDVAQVGVITLGTGVGGAKAKNDTHIGNIELAAGKYLKTENKYINLANTQSLEEETDKAVRDLTKMGAQAFVAAEAFSVDNPENETVVVQNCAKKGYPATASNEVSKLYGLKVRTRTAVVNASILPKMLEAANMTEKSIKEAHIETPLMVMRCDGGVMTVDEVRSRPILTILSGPAAGVAGALMYEKLTDGIFMEVGGTSTDISCVKDGNVMIKYAEIGGHKTYLNSLDVRTVGIGGGSMIVLKEGKAVDVGPRSAHIANLEYEVYTDEDDIDNPELKSIQPMEGDPEYAYVECANGKRFALTLSGAANIAGYVKKENYASGNTMAAKKAWEPLAKKMGLTVEETARKVLEFSARKNGAVVESLIRDYGLDRDTLIFVGGGGGAATVAPHLAEIFHCKHKIAQNAAVISPIGVALAMIRDMVERTVMNPSEEDLISIRKEAFDLVLHSGAAPESITVKVEVDSKMNKLRAIAMGTTELRTKDMVDREKDETELKKIAAESMKVSENDVYIEAQNEYYRVISSDIVKKVFLLFHKKIHPIRLIDPSGVIRLQRQNGVVKMCKGNQWKEVVSYLINEYTECNDGGDALPNIYIVYGSKVISLTSMQSREQMTGLAAVELADIKADENLIIISTLTTENQR